MSRSGSGKHVVETGLSGHVLVLLNGLSISSFNGESEGVVLLGTGNGLSEILSFSGEEIMPVNREGVAAAIVTGHNSGEDILISAVTKSVTSDVDRSSGNGVSVIVGTDEGTESDIFNLDLATLGPFEAGRLIGELSGGEVGELEVGSEAVGTS
jgi:hypothetical protein